MTTKTETTEETTTEDTGDGLSKEARLNEAHRLVRRASAWGFGAGCIPLPLEDLATITGVQLKMISNLSNLYGIPFRDHTAKNIIAGLLGSIVPQTLAMGSVGSILKAVPLVGGILGVLSMPGFASAATWAVGQVFIKHMESGGTLLDFDVEKMRAHFLEEFEAKKQETTAGPTKAAS